MNETMRVSSMSERSKILSVPSNSGENRHRRVIVVGSGPAGYTAAIYTARADLEPLVLEGSQPGGALMTTSDVENFPGFPEGITGPELMGLMRAQAERFGAKLISDDVSSMDLSGSVKIVRTYDTEYTADTVILCMGSAHRKLGISREDELSGHGVSWCATCDGYFFRGQDIAVVGGGDTALEEASFLSKFARSVTIVHRRDTFRASQIMIDRVKANPKISICWNSEVTTLSGDGELTGLDLRDTVSGEPGTLDVTGLFVAIGHDPRSELVQEEVELADGKYVRTAKCTHTNIAGVFAAGDLVDSKYQQAITAAGSGCQAALDVEQFLATRDHHKASVVAAV